MERRINISAEQTMEDSFQIPLVATLLFVVTMLAIYFLGRNMIGFYTPSISDQAIELTQVS